MDGVDCKKQCSNGRGNSGEELGTQLMVEEGDSGMEEDVDKVVAKGVKFMKKIVETKC